MPKTGKAQASRAQAGGRKQGGASGPMMGDEVLLASGGSEHRGIFIQKDAAGFITLKLQSGYNIGIDSSKLEKIEVISRASPPAPAAAAPKRQKTAHGSVSLLGCGGTIASRIDYRTGAVYAATTSEELLASLPRAAREGVLAKNIYSMMSEDMSPAHWQKIAEVVSQEISEGAQGVVVTHGTDTISYTASALSFMLQNLPCPVVITGSQRSSDRGSSDAEANAHASIIAAKADLSGVFVCMHENLSDDACLLHFGTKVRKMHTSRRDAFRSINVLPAARIFPFEGRLEKISPLARPRNPASRPSLDARLNPNVALLHSYPGMRPETVSALSKYDGVVLAGTGLGHLPINNHNDPIGISIFDPVKALIDSGIPVFLASQTVYGRVNLNVYSPQRRLREIGVMGHMCDMTPETAYVKMMWVLGREKKMEKVRQMMEANLTGEISPRTELTGY